MTQSTPELLPCPFCGGKAETVMQHWGHDAERWGVMSCNALGHSFHFDCRTLTETEAIAAWNRRSTPDRNAVVGWQPIETAPTVELEPILLFNGGDDVTAGCWWEGMWTDFGQSVMLPAPTHWMPLPAPPCSLTTTPEPEYRCAKCGAQADERYDCCEVTTPEPKP